MTQEPEKKIFVDEDWKNQVERERQAAEAAQSPGKKPPADEAAPASETPLPPPNLSYLASTIFFEASMFLGLMPTPGTNRLQKDLRRAKHLIDLLEVLQQKTEGNRTAEETETFEAMLHQLRMAYVQST